MKLAKRLLAALCAVSMAVPFASVRGLTVGAAQNVVLSPDSTYAINDGEFEGWGTSLCWWANRVGYSDSLSQKAAEAFYGDSGLRLNIARFNIGGGDDPTHHHITRTDSNMPGYTVYSNGKATYDWTKDYNQRNVLRKAIEACGDDMIVEMFSNSPPYYMTYSGCSSGGDNPGKNNLRDDQYDDFANYLAEVCYHYEHDWGIKVQSVEALNEPYTNFWGKNSPKQEGCHFDIGDSESRIILELDKAMKARGMDDVLVVGTDETSIDTQIQAYNALSGDAKKALDRIDTHTYAGSKRSQLKDTAIAAGKNLWMSEVDGSGTAGTNAGEMSSALWLAQRITTDVNDLNASAWIMWQVIDNHISKVGMNGNKDKGMVNTNGGFWGVAVADHDNDKIVLTKKYYAFGQYSRYIRPGMTMLNSAGNCVAAYDKDLGRVVVVAYNTSGNSADISFDLSGFSSVGTSAQVIRTSKTENWKDVGNIALTGTRLNASLAANSVTTFLIDGCSGNTGNAIDLSQAEVSGSDSWKGNADTDFRKAFDGKLDTYFDGLNGGWVQADLGAVYNLSAIGYCPRKSYEYRMPDGYFEVSLDGENWTKVHTITTKPDYSMHKVRLANVKAKYIRYAVPDGKPSNQYNKDDSYNCNVAEIAVYGQIDPASNFEKLDPVKTSGSDPWQNRGAYDQAKAFDGKLDTFFDGVGSGWVMADLGEVCELNVIGYAPRDGFAARMVDAYFEVSEDGTNWQKVYTVGRVPSVSMQYAFLEEPAKGRYVRYAVPEGKPNNGVNTDNVYCCNIAEIELYGAHQPEPTTEPPTTEAPTTEPPTEPKPVVGDVDADGNCKVADLVMLQKYVLGVGKLTDADAADVTGDGAVDVFDVALLKRLLLK
ncbi:MAG: discoidin domain-containing protein [Oscillospiraceae bacterium]|nr:discoidin domain-containing protein [Oscillospiraceae bacterium]